MFINFLFIEFPSSFYTFSSPINKYTFLYFTVSADVSWLQYTTFGLFS